MGYPVDWMLPHFNFKIESEVRSNAKKDFLVLGLWLIIILLILVLLLK